MFTEGAYMGEYEKSKGKHVDAKIEEIGNAEDELLKAYREHGKIKVRWTTGPPQPERKQIRREDGTVIGHVSQEHWTERNP
jgi:hypothetical protein